MLRVVLAVSNFLETPNGGGAGGIRQPAGASSLRERCDGRGNNPHGTPNDSRAVALRTRKHRLSRAKTTTLWCARTASIHPNTQAVVNGRMNGCRPAWSDVRPRRSAAARLFSLSAIEKRTRHLRRVW